MNPKYVTRFIQAIVIQFSLIFLFSLIYYSIINDFKSVITTKEKEYVDCLLLSSTIQAGIGISNILPQTSISIFATILQQLMTIISALFIVFTFTIN